jgi:hypothetical protein
MKKQNTKPSKVVNAVELSLIKVEFIDNAVRIMSYRLLKWITYTIKIGHH